MSYDILIRYFLVMILPTIYLYILATFVLVRSYHLKIAKQIGAFSLCIAIAYTFDGLRILAPLEHSHFMQFFLVLLPMNLGFAFVLHMVSDVVNTKTTYQFKFSPYYFYLYPVLLFMYGLLEEYVIGYQTYIKEDGWIYREHFQASPFNTILTYAVYFITLYMLLIGLVHAESKKYKQFFKLSLVFLSVGLVSIVLSVAGVYPLMYFIPQTPGLFLNIVTATLFTIVIAKLDFVPSFMKRYDNLLHTSPTAIIYVDEWKKIIEMNDVARQSFCAESGYHLSEIINFKEHPQIMDDLFIKLDETSSVKGYLVHYWDQKLGERFILIDGSKVDSGLEISYYMMLHDVTIEYKQRKISEYLAYHDSLTGIYNRAYFEKYVKSSLEELPSNREAVLIISDLNDFKKINDTLGHHVGDEVLKFVTQELKRILPQRVVFARFGGDEFVMYFENTPSEKQFLASFSTVKNHMQNLVFYFEEKPIPITMSFGIACSQEVGKDFDQLYRVADMKMYANKKEIKSTNQSKVYIN